MGHYTNQEVFDVIVHQASSFIGQIIAVAQNIAFRSDLHLAVSEIVPFGTREHSAVCQELEAGMVKQSMMFDATSPIQPPNRTAYSGGGI